MAFRRLPRNAVAVPARRSVVTAAAAQIALDGTSWRNWKLGDQRWQEEAWRHYDISGGLRYAADWMGNALSQCRIYLAKLDENGEAGEEVTDPRLAIVARTMFGGPTQQAEALRTLGIQLYMVGESYVVAESVESANKDIWYIVSTSEIRRQGGKVIVDRSHVYGGGRHELDEGKDLLMRVWTPHPRKYDSANSPVRAALPDLRELEQLRKKVFAQIDSRLAGAGLLFLPDELEFPSGDDDATGGAAGLMKVIERAMAQAILDQSNASALVPIIVQIAGEYIDKIKWQTFETPFQGETLALRQEAIRALALALDQPAEILLGQGSTNHWGAWQIEESTIKIQIKPLGGRITDALYSGYGRAALTILKADPDEYTFGFDTSELVIRPDRQADALAVADRISDAAIRAAGNWSEDDAPDDAEQERRLALQIVLAKPDLITNKDIQKALGVSWDIEDPAEAAAGALPQPGNGQAPQPRALPQQPRDSETPAQEAALLVGADLIVRRALEKAGNRLLTAPRRGQFAHVPAWELHQHIEVTPGDAARLVAEAWEPASALAFRIGMDPSIVVDMLRTYTVSLISHGEGHDYDRFGLYLTQSLDLIGHGDCAQFCRNPLHPGPCRGWRRQLGTPPGERRDLGPVDEAARGRRRAPETGNDRDAEQVGWWRPGDPDPPRQIVEEPPPQRGRRRAPETGSDAEAERRVSREQAGRIMLGDAEYERRVGGGRKLKEGLDPKKDLADALQDPARLTEAQRRVREAMQAAYYINDRESGLRTDIREFSLTARGSKLRVWIMDRDGRQVGTSVRTWTLDPDGRLTAYHAFLSLDSDVQAGGFSQRYNANAEEVYRDAGVSWINIHADLDVGGYTWASQGYDFQRREDLSSVAARFRRHARRLDPDDPLRAEINRLLRRATQRNFDAGTHPTPYEFAMIGKDRAAPQTVPDTSRQVMMWPGKKLMLGSDWMGRKPITESVRAVVAAAGIDGWDARERFLDDVAAASLDYANEVAQRVPAYPQDAHPNTQGETDYAEHHHLISAEPDIAEEWLDIADELLGPDNVVAAAETETFHLPGRHDQKTHGHRRGSARRSSIPGVGPFTEEEKQTRARQRRGRPHVDPDREAGAPQRQGRRMMGEWTGEAERLNRANQEERDQFEAEGARRAATGTREIEAKVDEVRSRPRPPEEDAQQREWATREAQLREEHSRVVQRLSQASPAQLSMTSGEHAQAVQSARDALDEIIERERAAFFGGNPRKLVGGRYGKDWHKMLQEDTGWDAPIPVENLTAGHPTYQVRSGYAYRVDGVGYLVEGPVSKTVAREIAQSMAQIHREQLPADATTYQQAYTWARHTNPGDAYWQQRFNRPGHRADASAGGGGVTFWGRGPQRRVSTDPSNTSSEAWAIVHEYGHNFDYGQDGRYIFPRISNHPDWSATAIDRDAEYNLTSPGRVVELFTDYTRSRFKITHMPSNTNSNAEVPTGVTTYGQSSLQEDFAESLALYRAGAIGRGTVGIGSERRVPIYFRDLFPHRAAILDRHFPELAVQQRAETEAQRVSA